MSARPKLAGDPAPIPPIPPDLEACCGSGCDPCVFDVYEVARDRYLAALAAWQQRQNVRGASD
jgi:hypothetical protein